MRSVGICGCFSEGFDAAGLKEAKALIAGNLILAASAWQSRHPSHKLSTTLTYRFIHIASYRQSLALLCGPSDNDPPCKQEGAASPEVKSQVDEAGFSGRSQFPPLPTGQQP